MAQDIEVWEAANALDETMRQRLAAHARLRSYGRGEVIVDEGTPATEVMIVIEGVVELFGRCADGRSAVVEILWPQEGFGIAAALENSEHVVSARSLDESRVLVIDAAALREVLGADPQVGRLVFGLLVEHTRRLVRQVKDLKLRTGVQRLGCFILRLVDSNDGDSARLPLPKSTLASRLGMTPETLSRAFASLRRDGLDIRGSRVRIRDRAKLEAACRPHPAIDGDLRPTSSLAA